MLIANIVYTVLAYVVADNLNEMKQTYHIFLVALMLWLCFGVQFVYKHCKLRIG